MRKAPSKAAQERIERMLNELFKLPGNDQCADCTYKNPRWASYSLGVFLCIRCASLHRKMGTHISKVKSVSMDRWSTDEVQFMNKLGGNKQVNNRVNPSPALHPLPLALDDDQ
ncbi:Arf GTPase activating protein [Backusella circina FSU 941]|nr:Arf GTPase activating protein [Backusella circina FSU 941]